MAARIDQRIKKALKGAVSIAWDGCHKIYIIMDETQHQKMVEWEYDILHRVDESSFQKISDWYVSSCGLRFVSAVRTVEGDPNDGFTHLVEQCQEWDA